MYIRLFVCVRYVFHSAGIFPDPSYQNRVQYLGRPGTKNCSLQISDLRPSDSGNYVFYLITSHPAQKMPEQRGMQLLVAGGNISFTITTDYNHHHHHHQQQKYYHHSHQSIIHQWLSYKVLEKIEK